MANFYIDFENVHNEGLKGILKLSAEDCLHLFFSNKADTMKIDVVQKLMQCKAEIKFVKIDNGIENALDFQLITALMCDYAVDNSYYIISRDKGYDAAIEMAQKRDRRTVYRCKDIMGALKHIDNLAVDESDFEIIVSITDEAEATESEDDQELLRALPEEEAWKQSGERVQENNESQIEKPAEEESIEEMTEAVDMPESYSEPSVRGLDSEVQDEKETAGVPEDEKARRAYQSICTKILNTIKINHKIPLNYRQAEIIYKVMQETSSKMEFYRGIIKPEYLGKKEGGELYGKLKPIYKSLRGIYKASVATAEVATEVAAANCAVKTIDVDAAGGEKFMMEVVMEALSEEALAGEDVEAEAMAIVEAVKAEAKIVEQKKTRRHRSTRKIKSDSSHQAEGVETAKLVEDKIERLPRAPRRRGRRPSMV